MSRERSLGLPLLTKEMIEHAARKRTYVIRTVYAVLLFGFALLIFWGAVYSRNRNALELLGKGREFFLILMGLQTAGVFLFTPALTCGGITIEKERNTLCLLLLTRLSPTTIVLEKYLSRLLMMLTFLLIALPLFGFCYALGGIEQKSVWAGFAALLVSVLQLSAVGLFCSSFFRTTVQAFIASYLIGFLLLFGPIILGEVFDLEFVRSFGRLYCDLMGDAVGLTAAFGLNLIDMIADLTGLPPLQHHPSYSNIQMDGDLEGGMMFNAPILVIDGIESRWGAATPAWSLLVRCIPALFSGFCFLVMARLVLIWRAFVTPRNFVVEWFGKLDGLFKRLNNNRFTKGRVLIAEQQNLPVDEPIAWRETTKTSLGNIRYLTRILVVVQIPILWFCLQIVLTSDGYRGMSPALSILYFFAWIVAVLLVCVRAATLVSKERSHETLDVLLSTPISSTELVRQKFRGVSRLILVLMIPLFTILLSHTWYQSIARGTFFNGFFNDLLNHPENCPFVNFVIQTLCILIYLPMVAWLCFYIGLWVKNQTRAIFTAVAVVVAWCVMTLIIIISIFDVLNINPGNDWGILLLSSPAIIPFLSEIREIDDIGNSVVSTVFMNTLIHLSLLFFFRYLCHRNAAKMLGRSEV